MPIIRRCFVAAVCCTLGVIAPPGGAQTSVPAGGLPPLKIGLIMSFTGGTTWSPKQSPASINAWMRLHGDTVAGRKSW
jgi:hypothetical protein